MDYGACEHCGRSLILARSGARFCSSKCRVYAFRAAKRLPVEMTSKVRWVRASGKRPVTVEGRAASSTNPATWSSFSAVRESSVGDGFGFMLGDGVGCYDLDHVSDVQARAFIATVQERVLYVERSRSGEGVHVFVAAGEERGWKRTVDGIHVERYTRARFIRMTGDRIQV